MDPLDKHLVGAWVATSPYLRWREKHISFYECMANRKNFVKHKKKFDKIRVEFAIQLGLTKRQVKCRLIGCVAAIYVTKTDYEKRRMDLRAHYRDHKDYSHFLYGLLVGSNPRSTMK